MRIVCPWKDRDGYVSIMLTTLKEAMRGHNDVHLSMYNHQSTQPIPPIAKDYGDQIEHVMLHSVDCHHTFIDMFNAEFAVCDDDYIVSIDSDCCVHPKFIDAVKSMVNDLPNMCHGSLYSEGNHPEPIEVVKSIYHQRCHISMTACIVSRKAWEAFPKPQPGDEIRFGCIDGAFSTFCHEQFKGCYSTRRSYVQHIGDIGAYSNQDGGGISTCHRARRFDP